MSCFTGKIHQDHESQSCLFSTENVPICTLKGSVLQQKRVQVKARAGLDTENTLSNFSEVNVSMSKYQLVSVKKDPFVTSQPQGYNKHSAEELIVAKTVTVELLYKE